MYTPQAGDRVRVVGRNDNWDGLTGTVVAPDGYNNNRWEITGDYPTDDYGNDASDGRRGSLTCYFDAEQLEKIDSDLSKGEAELLIQHALYSKYAQRAPEDASWLARDDAAVIMRNLDTILPILRRIK